MNDLYPIILLFVVFLNWARWNFSARTWHYVTSVTVAAQFVSQILQLEAWDQLRKTLPTTPTQPVKTHIFLYFTLNK